MEFGPPLKKMNISVLEPFITRSWIIKLLMLGDRDNKSLPMVAEEELIALQRDLATSLLDNVAEKDREKFVEMVKAARFDSCFKPVTVDKMPRVWLCGLIVRLDVLIYATFVV
jgi:hypothetical protein